MKYSLDELIERFDEHHKEYRNTPHLMKDDFSLPLALATICREIQELKKWIGPEDHL